MEKSINYLELHKEVKESLEGNQKWADLAENFNKIGQIEDLKPYANSVVLGKLIEFLENLLNRIKSLSPGQELDDLKILQDKAHKYVKSISSILSEIELAKDIDYVDED